LRDDPNYDALILALYPDIDKYEEEVMHRLSSYHTLDFLLLLFLLISFNSGAVFLIFLILQELAISEEERTRNKKVGLFG
jgi:hypothetical protein